MLSCVMKGWGDTNVRISPSQESKLRFSEFIGPTRLATRERKSVGLNAANLKCTERVPAPTLALI